MLRWLGKLRANPPVGEGAAPTEAWPAAQMAWRAGTTLPIPDWAAQPPSELHANRQAAGWLDALAAALPPGYVRAESPHFMLLTAQDRRTRDALLRYLERSRTRVMGTLPGIADDHGHGKTVVIVFAGEESYYRYVAHYGSSSAEPEAFSSGMFIDAGYGHFVFAQAPFETMEPVVVHELTHCLVRHLPIPAWLNEGLAVNTEQRYAPRMPRYRANELQYLFGRFWNAGTIQEFWSGKSFLRPDDGQPLSYELARILVQLLDKDYEVLRRFCGAASQDDGGEHAARQVLGAGLAELVTVVLGPGDWTPDPPAWAAGTERGQFRGSPASPIAHPPAVPTGFRLANLKASPALPTRRPAP